jgi:hypothetical protein
MMKYGSLHDNYNKMFIYKTKSISNNHPNIEDPYKLSNWKSYNYGNDLIKSLITHFDGITSDG